MFGAKVVSLLLWWIWYLVLSLRSGELMDFTFTTFWHFIDQMIHHWWKNFRLILPHFVRPHDGCVVWLAARLNICLAVSPRSAGCLYICTIQHMALENSWHERRKHMTPHKINSYDDPNASVSNDQLIISDKQFPALNFNSFFCVAGAVGCLCDHVICWRNICLMHKK